VPSATDIFIYNSTESQLANVKSSVQSSGIEDQLETALSVQTATPFLYILEYACLVGHVEFIILFSIVYVHALGITKEYFLI